MYFENKYPLRTTMQPRMTICNFWLTAMECPWLEQQAGAVWDNMGCFFDELRPDLTLKGFPDPKMSIEFWVRMVEIAKSKLEKRGMGFFVPVEGRTEIRQRKMFWMKFFLWTSRDKKSPKRNPPPNHKENLFSTNFGEVNQISSFLWVNCWSLEISTPKKTKDPTFQEFGLLCWNLPLLFPHELDFPSHGLFHIVIFVHHWKHLR